jgi:Zn-dependent M28 family amino/carboxypeptidase
VISASVPLRTVEVTGSDVRGRLRTFTTGCPDVLLTARFDDVRDDPGQRMPAAADNAPGVAVVLEAARLLADALPDSVGSGGTLLDAEEAGALGSAHHAPTVPAGTAVLNIDGAAQLSDSASVEAGGPAHGLVAALGQAGRETGVPLRAGAMASDNRRYAEAGLAAIGIGMGMPATKPRPRPPIASKPVRSSPRLGSSSRPCDDWRNPRRLSHESALRGGEREALPDWTLADAEPHVVELAQEIEPPWAAAVDGRA